MSVPHSAAQTFRDDGQIQNPGSTRGFDSRSVDGWLSSWSSRSLLTQSLGIGWDWLEPPDPCEGPALFGVLVFFHFVDPLRPAIKITFHRGHPPRPAGLPSAVQDGREPVRRHQSADRRSQIRGRHVIFLFARSVGWCGVDVAYRTRFGARLDPTGTT